MARSAQRGSHPDLINRLKRAEGHLRSFIGMVGTGEALSRDREAAQDRRERCQAAKRELIHDHIDQCGHGGEDELAALRYMAKVV